MPLSKDKLCILDIFRNIILILITTICIAASGRLSIVKKCGLSPCSLSDLNSWTDECDRKSDEDSYTCTSCCRETTCNGQSRLSQEGVVEKLFFIVISSIIFIMNI